MSNSHMACGFRVACIVPTYNGRDELSRLLDSLAVQTCPHDLFIVDSSSVDGTDVLAKSRCVNLFSISSSDFNHGATRQMMVERNPDYDVYVFMTQDAYLADSDALSRLVAVFENPAVGAVCGRQLPHLDANPLARHARLFNYPGTSQVKSLADASRLGLKTPFMSNSFAAYRASAFKEAGGFPDHVILCEDMYIAARMLLKGWKVAYAGDACCHHSHNYSFIEEFKRYFDIGVFHAREPWIRERFGGAGGEGLKYVISELKFLGLKRLHWWPVSLLNNAAKLVGYKLGQQEEGMLLWLKKMLSMHKRYWDSVYAEKS